MKLSFKIAAFAALLAASVAWGGQTDKLCTAVTATGAQLEVQGWAQTKTYQASGTTTAGSGSAVIAVEGSNNGTSWDSIGSITLTLGTTSTSDSFTSNDRYTQVRCNVGTLTGTGATVSATVGH